MKTLLLAQKEQRVILDRLYDGISSAVNCDVRRLTKDNELHLKKYFKNTIDITQYDRIILFLRFKRIRNQTMFIKTIPNLVIFEYDACQNFCESKYHGQFSTFYRKLRASRIIVTGATLAERLKAEGFDAIFVPKGYDQKLLCNLHLKRDIELGFLGSINHSTYASRKKFLEALSTRENLQIMRTNSGQEYAETMNRIRFFVSVDMGFDEYMGKNFEAMACGCVLFAYDQGDFENQSLGFKDMEHLVLYRSLDEFIEKLYYLRKNPEIADQIAKTGQLFVEQNYTFEKIGQKIAAALEPPLQTVHCPSFFEKIRSRIPL